MNKTSIEKREEGLPQQQQQQQAQTNNGSSRRTDRAAWFTPLVDIVETGEALLFQADLPGVKGDDVDIDFANGVLSLTARVQPRLPQDQRYAWQEYDVGHFHRTFTIDAPVDVDGIRAELKNGVLNLYVPKAENARRRKIQVQAP